MNGSVPRGTAGKYSPAPDGIRPPSRWPSASISVDDDAGRGQRRVAAAMDELYGYFGLRGLERCTVSGPPDDCVRGVREVADAGAELILLNSLFDEAEQLERLAAEVVPHVG